MGIKTVISKNVKKIISELSKTSEKTKKALNIGIILFLVAFALGTLFIVLNRLVYNYDLYIEYIGMSIIKSSFTILAEVIVGCLLLDYVFNKA